MRVRAGPKGPERQGEQGGKQTASEQEEAWVGRKGGVTATRMRPGREA